MAPHSSTLAWKIPWMEEPGGLQSMGSLRVRHDWATSLSLFTFMHWRRKWQATPVFLPGESQGWGSLMGCHLMGSHRVGHDWSNLATAAAPTSWIPVSTDIFFLISVPLWLNLPCSLIPILSSQSKDFWLIDGTWILEKSGKEWKKIETNERIYEKWSNDDKRY